MDDKNRLNDGEKPQTPADREAKAKRRILVGIATGALLVAGLITGGIYLSGRQGGTPAAPGSGTPTGQQEQVDGEKPCEHDWTVTYKTVHHDAVTHTETVEPVYGEETTYHTVCNDCQQTIDGIGTQDRKRYMHHYNFPSYSVGETKPSRGPGRREIGHGALAERALVPVLPTEEEFPYAIRTVSETFESNGSTSQASICASTMSLMAAGVPIKKPVAGISCGLVTGETDDDYLVLTDIQGLEDFFGDMDFKVAGTHDGITAIQMDIKIHGLTRQIVEEAIARTKQAREYILTEVMEKAIAEPRKTVGEFAPKIIQMMIDPQKIGEVVGQRGKTINAIIDETGVKIDITDDGAVSICGTEQAMMDQAKKYIEIIASDFTEGQILTGKVVSIKDFGAFLEFAPGKEGLVHISKLAKQRVEKVEDVVSLGDVVKVVCMGKDKMGRVSFSIKDVPADAK